MGAMKMLQRYHTLGKIGATYDFEQMHAAIGAATDDREAYVTIGLDCVDLLDATVLRELIRGVRKIRETGGGLRLHVTRPALASALQAIGLEKIFEITVDRGAFVAKDLTLNELETTKRYTSADS